MRRRGPNHKQSQPQQSRGHGRQPPDNSSRAFRFVHRQPLAPQFSRVHSCLQHGRRINYNFPVETLKGRVRAVFAARRENGVRILVASSGASTWRCCRFRVKIAGARILGTHCPIQLSREDRLPLNAQFHRSMPYLTTGFISLPAAPSECYFRESGNRVPGRCGA